jgi:Fe2+ transport system protein B
MMLCIPIKVNWHLERHVASSFRVKEWAKQETILLATHFMLVSCFACFSTLKIEAICSSEMSVHFQQTTRYYIPDDRTLHNHHCENLKSYLLSVSSYIAFRMSHIYMFLSLKIGSSQRHNLSLVRINLEHPARLWINILTWTYTKYNKQGLP